jgi:peptidoglycan/xylan/chitin deacetylase (PgdA/CDA1 family)
MPDNEMTKICVTIDTEGDSSENPYSTFFGIELALPLLIKVFSRFGIKATFFIQEDKICRAGSMFLDLWKSLENDGHEIGYHAHGLIRASAEEKEEIITSGLQILRESGLHPISFRGGRYCFSGSMIRILEKNGIQYDSSVVPGLRELFRDGTVRCNHLGAPHHPYFPSYENHCKEGDSKILEIPINRYPYLPSQMSGVLKGKESLEEVLFDYFYAIRKDKIIIINVHPWDGLSAILNRLIRNERFGYFKKIGFNNLAKMISSRSLVNRSYSSRFDSFLEYVSKKDNVCFATVRDVGLNAMRNEEEKADEE